MAMELTPERIEGEIANPSRRFFSKARDYFSPAMTPDSPEEIEQYLEATDVELVDYFATSMPSGFYTSSGFGPRYGLMKREIEDGFSYKGGVHRLGRSVKGSENRVRAGKKLVLAEWSRNAKHIRGAHTLSLGLDRSFSYILEPGEYLSVKQRMARGILAYLHADQALLQDSVEIEAELTKTRPGPLTSEMVRRAMEHGRILKLR